MVRTGKEVRPVTATKCFYGAARATPFKTKPGTTCTAVPGISYTMSYSPATRRL